MELTKFQIAAIKRTAQTVNPMINKVNKINLQLENLLKEKQELCNVIDSYEAPIKAMTGNWTSSDLVTKNKDEKGVVTYSLKDITKLQPKNNNVEVDESEKVDMVPQKEDFFNF